MRFDNLHRFNRSFIIAARCPRFISAVVLLLMCGAFFTSTIAQSGAGVDLTGTSGVHTIQGRIYAPSGQRTSTRLQVRLQSTSFGELIVLSDANGAFSFRSIGPGSYTVVIDGGNDFETTRETVFIQQDVTIPGLSRRDAVARSFTVPIYLRPKRGGGGAATTPPGIVNAALAGVPKPAQDLYTKALQAAAKKDFPQAIADLKGAITLYPRFALAHTELGTQYIRLRRFDDATTALRSALAIAPDLFTARLHIGIALFEKGDFKEARAQLVEAARRNDSNAIAHLYLGMSHVKLRELNEAEATLLRAIRRFGEAGGKGIATAHYYLGGIYWSRKQYSRAAEELETYLRFAPTAPDAERVRATIKELRGKS